MPKNSRSRPARPADLGIVDRAHSQFRQGRDFELDLAMQALRKADGIGSGVEAAEFLSRMEHRPRTVRPRAAENRRS